MSSLISIVILVYNEQENIPNLVERLIASMNQNAMPYEVIFTNDGSKDESLILLQQCIEKNPGIIRVVDFKGNYGQHMAIIAAFEESKGDIIVTLDADLQNPPEEIVKLINKMKDGYDYVGSYRDKRKDTFFRK